MRILIIDDEVDFLTIMENVLREKGYEVIKAQDGKQAREAMEGEKIDLIVSDVFMPTLDGAVSPIRPGVHGLKGYPVHIHFRVR